jgi:uncharacterized membrane protein affecting hemolysin expression
MHHRNTPRIPNTKGGIKAKLPVGKRSEIFMPVGSVKKFVIIAFAAGMILGLLFGSLSFMKLERDNSKDAVMYFASGQAKLISSNVKCALSFDDSKDANSILNSLRNQYNIAFAGIYDCNGRLFATYYRGDVNEQSFDTKVPPKAKFTSRHGYIVVSEPVIHSKQFLGTVCLWAQP